MNQTPAQGYLRGKGQHTGAKKGGGVVDLNVTRLDPSNNVAGKGNGLALEMSRADSPIGRAHHVLTGAHFPLLEKD